jgi:hypothetical protein
MRKVIALAVAAVAIAAPLPALAGGAATTGVDTWTNEPNNNFGQDACTGQWETGIGSDSGIARWVETENGGFHITGQVSGVVPFYEALGPGPWDPQPGAYIGTWTFQGTFDEQDPRPAPGATSGTAHGVMVYADGTTRRINKEFHLTFGDDGPKVFFANAICAGA